MALSLGSLAAAEGLPVLAGSGGLGRVIGWVHPTELVDPTAFLDGGELLLTTGLAFELEAVAPTTADDSASTLAAAGGPASATGAAGDPASATAVGGLSSARGVAGGSDVAYETYVERLVRAGVAGIGFGSGVIHDRVPPGLVAAAEAAGLPLLEVPHEVPFIAITKAVSAAVAADEYATVVRTGRGQQELTRAAVGRGGPGAVVRRLSRLVDGWVLLLDSGTPVEGVPGTGTPVEAFPASARTHAASLDVSGLRGTRGTRLASGDEVVLHSLDSRTVLAVGRGVELDAAEQFIVNTAASLLSLALQRNREQSGVLGQLRSGLFDLLLADEDLAVATIRRLWPAMPEPPWRIAVVVGSGAARRAFAEALGEVFCVARDSDVVVVAPDVEAVEPLVRRFGLHGGISSAVGSSAAVVGSGSSASSAAVASPGSSASSAAAASSAAGGSAGAADPAGAAGSAGVGDSARAGDSAGAVGSAGSAEIGGSAAAAGSLRIAGSAGAGGAAGTAGSAEAAGSAGAAGSAEAAGSAGAGGSAGGGVVGDLAPVGRGRVGGAVSVATALRQAVRVAQAARAQHQPWLGFDEYTGSGLLALISDESGALFSDAVLSPLSGDLVEALRCWIEEHGHYDAAATRLNIHRHTLRKRLRKVEELTGRSLASPGVRAEFWVALAVAER